MEGFAAVAASAIPRHLGQDFAPPAPLAFGQVFEHRWRRYLSQGHVLSGGGVLGKWLVLAKPIVLDSPLACGPEQWVGEAPVLPEVINLRHYRGKGRPDKPPAPDGTIWVGRPRTLGNPYRVSEHGKEALPLYKRWLWQRIKARDLEVLRALSEISESSKLACTCKPGPCHADIIAAAWDYCRQTGLLLPKEARNDR